MKPHPIVGWILRIVPAIILLQTLYFKFSGHPESVMLFEKLNAEPAGRISVGIMELVTGILLLYPKTTRFGALLSVGTMAGAIASHLFIIGIESNGDGGVLFMLACIVMATSLINVWIYRDLLRRDLEKITKK